MIQVKKSYVLELTETQAKELYNLLKLETTGGGLAGRELNVIYHELKKIFDSGIRSTESFENSKGYNHLYAPGTK